MEITEHQANMFRALAERKTLQFCDEDPGKGGYWFEIDRLDTFLLFISSHGGSQVRIKPDVPDGFTAWGGGEQPAETRGKRVHFLLRDGEDDILPADCLRWDHVSGERRGDILAYRLADEQPAAVPAPSSDQGHPHATQMAQYADDAAKTMKPWLLWECHRRDLPADRPWTALVAHPEWNPSHDYRRKPRMIVVNGIEVPAPERVAPGSGERYFVPHLGATNLNHCCYWGQAGGDSDDLRFLDRGLVHLRHESAAAHARALLAHKPG